ncbi:mitochondrial chaperone [Grosmannia clavigera kw1407]|uniref:ferroxidase n=1 Tax=Grosmannia clavigera (strain kw1407 / UAMH 11150) TaxID=655863 RepID=F0X6T7_GROCL|nr:mitochondrial chaperone [Grosmannia clavigera kw1407]EFX06192.1 mitochondrial chaperone [Grosmannia clavigera kw1407]
MPRPIMTAPVRLVRLRKSSTSTTTAPFKQMSTARQLARCCHQCRPAGAVLVSAPARWRSCSVTTISSGPFFSSSSASSASQPHHRQPASLSDQQYHELADDYLDDLLVRLEEMQDVREDVDVEFSAGVLTLSFAADSTGAGARTYVINKQPPNKQIWLSSPVSGPKRYDWVLTAEDAATTAGNWIYLKDGSSLNSLVKEEIGVDLSN